MCPHSPTQPVKIQTCVPTVPHNLKNIKTCVLTVPHNLENIQACVPTVPHNLDKYKHVSPQSHTTCKTTNMCPHRKTTKSCINAVPYKNKKTWKNDWICRGCIHDDSYVTTIVFLLSPVEGNQSGRFSM